jgi:hypothetical protein
MEVLRKFSSVFYNMKNNKKKFFNFPFLIESKKKVEVPPIVVAYIEWLIKKINPVK